jgi:ketosteroid isomerase-like protein
VALLTAALLLACAPASCGDTAGTARSTPAGSTGARAGGGGATAPKTTSNSLFYDGYLHEDGERDDDDPGTPHYEQDEHHRFLAQFGRSPRPTEARAITALIKRYFTAAAAGDSANACALLSTAASVALAAQHSSSTRGAGACAAAIAPPLAQAHQYLLTKEPTTMVVTGIYTKGDLGIAALGFRHTPESTILIEREASAWKIGSIFDNHMT